MSTLPTTGLPTTGLIQLTPARFVPRLLTLVVTAVAAHILTLSFLPSIAVAQNNDVQLNQLIFEPVAINPETGNVISENNFPEGFIPENPFDQDLSALVYDDSSNSNSPTGNTINNQVNNGSSSRSNLEIIDSIEQYLDAISQLETEEGPFAEELYQVLLDLGTQYQLAGEHEQAIEIFERAEHVSRVNHGLYHPQQFASIEKMIESYEALGDTASVNERKRYMIILSQEYYGDLDINTLPALVDFAEQNMSIFSRTLNMPVLPEISFSSDRNFPGGRSTNRIPRQMAFGSLRQAQQNYFRAIHTMVDNRAFFDPLLLDLEYRYLETLFLQTHRESIIRDPDYYMSDRRAKTGSRIRSNRRYGSGFTNGKYVFERMLIYINNNPEARLYHKINALMEYGDWIMLYDRGGSAQKKYQEAYQLLAEADLLNTYEDSLFRPAVPVHLPLFTAKPNTREKFGISENQDIDFAGYIDISFTISKYGRAKQFETLGKSDNTTREIERRLRRFLRNSPFRPRMDENGEFNADRVILRYNYTFADQVPPQENQLTSS